MMMLTTTSAPVDLCLKVQCDRCNKITWKGCGRHAEEVMKDVEEEDKCKCNKGA